MNNIEILEKGIKKMIEDERIHDDYRNMITAIKNLIQRNKDLEQIEKEHKEENGKLRDRIKELEEENVIQQKQLNSAFDRGYIPTSKIKEKIEEIIQNSSHFNMISPLNYDKEYYETRFAVDKLQELLGDDK